MPLQRPGFRTGTNWNRRLQVKAYVFADEGVFSMADQAEMNSGAQAIARLKYQYWQALRREYDTQVTTADTADDKRRKLIEQAKERENREFIDRLRRRLRDSGVSKEELRQVEQQPEKALLTVTAPPSPRLLKNSRTAILVIHGIGEQNPYETLDQFSRNLMRYLVHEGGIEDLEISADRYDRNDSVEARIRLSTSRSGPAPGQPAWIDLYEYYWAPQTEDKISYKETLSWLIKTTLTPLRLLNENIKDISDAEGHPTEQKDSGDNGKVLTRRAIFLRELRRIFLIYLPLLFVLAALAYLLPETIKLPANVKGIFESWSKDHMWSKAIMTALFVFALAIDLIVIRQLWKNFVRNLRRQPAIIPSRWMWQTFGIGLAFTAAGIAVGWLAGLSFRSYFAPLLHVNVLVFLIGAGLAKVSQSFLKNFVGDVAVYTNADAKAKNFQIRKAILAGSTTAVIRLLREQNVVNAGDTYDQIIVAGHSLGSVIAYDTLNQLLNKRHARADQIVGHVPVNTDIPQNLLNRIQGLITFGSPLDKVHYFFRENVPENQAVRAQLLQFLQSFRKSPSGLDYGLYRLQRYDASGLDGVTWLNAWSKQDPVSGALHFYTGLQRQEFKYRIPIYAHLSYWEDLRFYEFFAEPMLLGNQAVLQQKAMGAAV